MENEVQVLNWGLGMATRTVEALQNTYIIDCLLEFDV